MIQLKPDLIANRNIGIVFHEDLSDSKPHSHTFFELGYIIEGNAVHTLDGESSIVKTGDYVIIEPGSVHFFEKVNQNEKLVTLDCIFTAESINNNKKKSNLTFMDLLETPLLNVNTSQIINSPTNYVYHDKEGHILNMLYAMKYEYSNKMGNYYLLMKNLLNNIIIASVRMVSSKNVQFVSPTMLIKDYVSLHYAENDILSQISEISHYSTQYLSSKFKADTGETFKSFLQRTKCDAAEQLMMCTNMTVSEISEAVGYKDVKYFSEIFKKHKNVTPKQLKIHFDTIYNKN